MQRSVMLPTHIFTTKTTCDASNRRCDSSSQSQLGFLRKIVIQIKQDCRSTPRDHRSVLISIECFTGCFDTLDVTELLCSASVAC